MTDLLALYRSARWITANDIPFPADVEADLCECGIAIKAAWDYNNSLTRIVSIYLNDLRTKPLNEIGSFGVDFANAIEAGLNEAWRLGMRENDVTEMLPEWQDIVDGIVAEERSHIADFAEYLTQVALNASTMGAAITQASGRLDLWINRYNDVYNQAKLASADEKTKLEWIYGDTEHCDTCAGLNGIVAYSREWEAAAVKPQSPPNGNLSCGGWHCQCQLVPTDKRKSTNAYDKIIAVVLGGPD